MQYVNYPRQLRQIDPSTRLKTVRAICVSGNATNPRKYPNGLSHGTAWNKLRRNGPIWVKSIKIAPPDIIYSVSPHSFLLSVRFTAIATKASVFAGFSWWPPTRV